MAEPEAVEAARAAHPGAAVVAYVNTSAAVKAAPIIAAPPPTPCGWCARSRTDEVIFLPDQNLGQYVAAQVPEKKIDVWPGFCRTHHRVRVEDVQQARAAYPDAPILVHPSARRRSSALADFVGSTSQIIARGQGPARTRPSSSARRWASSTNSRRDNPGKTFFLLSPGLVCPNMKRTSPEQVRDRLRNLGPGHGGRTRAEPGAAGA